MKKTYICPNSEMITLVTENMIAASTELNVNPGKETDQWSNEKNGWSSEDWSGSEE